MEIVVVRFHKKEKYTIGKMYINQSNEVSIQLLNERIEKVTKEIEKTTV